MARSVRISPIIIKLAVVALVIKELWLLLGIPSFTDALLSFLTVGAIPGTNRTLTPDEMYKLLAGIGLVVIILVFRKDIARLFWRKHEDDSQPVQQYVEATPAAVPVPKPPRALAARRKTPAMPLAHPMSHLATPSFVNRARLWLSVTWSRAKSWTLLRYAQACAWAVAAARKVWAWTKLASLVAYRLLLLTIIIIVNASIAFWKWAKPYVNRFDAYIEKRVHANQYGAAGVRVLTDVADFIRRAFLGAKAIAKDLTRQREN